MNDSTQVAKDEAMQQASDSPQSSRPQAGDAGRLGNKPSGLELRNISKVYATGRKEVTAVSSVNLVIEPGEFVTLLGPSGCGKTTNLRMIAGFETPSTGEILLDGKDIVSVPPNKRPMSMVFQSYALFPHLNVEKNISFGLNIKKVPKDEIKRRVNVAMEAMDLKQYATRAPHELSGGQQQRVALARALVMEPKVLLFDEPLSNLDAKLRDQMRLEIRRIQQEFGITSVFVTHDQDEAMTMSDKIVVMSHGKIEQVGTPYEVYKHPRSRFVAEFLGSAHFFEVPVTAVREEGGQHLATVNFQGQLVSVPCSENLSVKESSPALLMMRAEDYILRPESVDSSAPISPSWTADTVEVHGTISSMSFHGDSVHYLIDLGDDTSKRQLDVRVNGHSTLLNQGDGVVVGIRPEFAWVLPQ